MGRKLTQAGLVLLLCSISTVALGQTKSSKSTRSSSKTTSQKSQANETEKELTGRLPRYFASLVDDEQRQEIYAIRNDFRDEIEALEKKLAALKVKEMQAVEKVLTTTQRRKLASLRDAGASKTASTSKSSSTKSSTSKSTPAKTVSAREPSSTSKSKSSKSTKSGTSKSSSSRSKSTKK